MKIAIMGTGGLGGYIGGRLVHTGFDVTFIARGQQLQAIRQSGLQVQSAYGGFAVAPVQVTDNPAEVGTADLILFCVKAYDTVAAADQIKPMVGPQTAILPVLNGIDHLEILSALFGPAHVLGGVAQITAHTIAPGLIEQIGANHLFQLGELNGSTSARCTQIQQVLTATGIETYALTDILEKMWWKLAAICGIAGVFSVVRGNAGRIGSTVETLNLVRQSVAECVAVAQARQIALSADVAELVINFVKGAPPTMKPSMLVDLEQGKRLEVAWLNGKIARLGRELGVATPVNDFIYACLKPYADGVQIQK